jgi:REP-associated tyrosine transposase
MPQSLDKVIIHAVFSTKNRIQFINTEIRSKLHAYLATIGRDFGSEVYRVGGADDHIHIAFILPRTVTIAKYIEKIKSISSAWIKENGSDHHDFQWQSGYGVFSVSSSTLSLLLDYIDNQEEHHRKQSFQEEYLAFLKKYDIKYDERYMWD